MLSVIMLSVEFYFFVMLSVMMQSGIILSAIMLSVEFYLLLGWVS